MDSTAALKTLRQQPEMQLRQLAVVKFSTIFSSWYTSLLPFRTIRYITIEDRLSGSRSGASLSSPSQQAWMSLLICREIVMMVFSLVIGVVPLLHSSLTSFRLSLQGCGAYFSSVLRLSSDSESPSWRANLGERPKKEAGLLAKRRIWVWRWSTLGPSVKAMLRRRNLRSLVRLNMVLMMRLQTFSFLTSLPRSVAASPCSPQTSLTTRTMSWTKTATSSTMAGKSSRGRAQRQLQKAMQRGLRKPPQECSWKSCAHLRKRRRACEYSARLISRLQRMSICITSDLFSFMLFWNDSVGSFSSPPSFSRIRHEFLISSSRFSATLDDSRFRYELRTYDSSFSRSSNSPRLYRQRASTRGSSASKRLENPQRFSSERWVRIDSRIAR